jgi:N-acetylmuramoyl-L-alanine amidase
LNPKTKKLAALLAVPASIMLGMVASVFASGGQASPQPQNPAGGQAPAVSRVVVLDAAHGGSDAGARLGDQLLEKDVTLALAARMKAALAAQGFIVVSTREADLLTPLTTDQRAEIANRAHALACIVIHATGRGSGVHVYASALPPKETADVDSDSGGHAAFEPIPWDTAQAESVGQSVQLETELSTALTTAKLPVLQGRASVRPLDNMMCPAVVIEVAPLVVADGDSTPVTDPDYQKRVADTLARAVQSWRGHASASGPRTAAGMLGRPAHGLGSSSGNGSGGGNGGAE